MDITALTILLEERGFHPREAENDDGVLPCVVWQELGEGYLLAGNRISEEVPLVQLSYFTENIADEKLMALKNLLQTIGLAFEMVRVEFERDRGIRQYVFEVALI